MLRVQRFATRQSAMRTVAAVSVLLLAPVLVLLFQGRLAMLAGAVAALLFVALSYFWPMPMLAIEMFLSTSALKFIGIKEWPHFIPGVPLDPPDILILVFFALGVVKLIRRRERPLFLGPILLFGLMVALSALLGPLTGTQTMYDSLNGIRQLTGYFFYFAVVGAIDTPRRLRALVGIIFAFLVITVGIQLLEALRGQQFTTAIAPFNEYYSGQMTVSVGELEGAYLWNRAVGYLLVGLFLALGHGLWARDLRSLLLVLLAVLGYVVQLIRQWYVFLSVGVVVSLLLLPRRRLQAAMRFALLGSVLGLSLIILTNASTNFPLADLWVARLGTLARAQEEPNFVFRIETWVEQLRLFRLSPLFGHGPGSANRLGAGGGSFIFFDLDVGMSNTLLQYGIFGTLAILTLIGAFFRRAVSLLRSLPESSERGYVAGLLAMWTVIVVGYATSQDFFTSIELAFAMNLALALLDRFQFFAQRGDLPAKEAKP